LKFLRKIPYTCGRPTDFLEIFKKYKNSFPTSV